MQSYANSPRKKKPILEWGKLVRTGITGIFWILILPVPAVSFAAGAETKDKQTFARIVPPIKTTGTRPGPGNKNPGMSAGMYIINYVAAYLSRVTGRAFNW